MTDRDCVKYRNWIRPAILIFSFGLLALTFQNCGEVSITEMSNEAPFEVTTTSTSSTSTSSTTSTTVPECGRYRIDKESFDQSGITVYRFTVSKETNGVFAQISPNPLSWASSSPGISNNQNATYTISDPTRTCSAVTVSARIENECGEEQSVSSAFTIAGCPEPQFGNVLCKDRHKIPNSTSLNVGWFKRPGGAPWNANTNLSSLGLALGVPVDSTLINSAGNVIFLRHNQHLQIALKTRAALPGTAANNRKFELNADSSGIDGPPGIPSGMCPMIYSISDCAGDFYIGRDPKGCVSEYSGANGLLAVFDAIPADNLQAHTCKLESGKTYYLNISAQNPMNGWQYPHADPIVGCTSPVSIHLDNFSP
jgi:hypothetical protein